MVLKPKDLIYTVPFLISLIFLFLDMPVYGAIALVLGIILFAIKGFYFFLYHKK